MRTRHFKMMLTEMEYAQLKMMAADQRCSSADLVRHLVLGPEAPRRIPSAATLKEVAYNLSSISSNINRCMKEIHSSKLAGELTDEQFAAMYRALEVGLKAWKSPRDELRNELQRFKKSS